MLSLVIPFIDRLRITEKCLESVVKCTTGSLELIVIDNGSDEDYSSEIQKLLSPNIEFKYIKNPINLGVLDSFNQGMKEASGDIVCFIHNDVLLHEPGWDKKITAAFAKDVQLGLAGLLGGKRIEANGDRAQVFSKIQGKDVGKLENYPVTAHYFGKLLNEVTSAIMLDGVGMFFRRSFYDDLKQRTTAVDLNVRPPHHWYDRNISLHAVKLGWHVAIIDIAFDHYVGVTSQSKKYLKIAKDWLVDHPDWEKKYGNLAINQAMYTIGLEQFMQEWSHQLPAEVDDNYLVHWQGRWDKL